MFRPLVALEHRVPDTQYVNILATFPAFRRRGVATLLLAEAGRRAAGARGLSLIVADGNRGARGSTRPPASSRRRRTDMVKEDWQSLSREWGLVSPRPPEARSLDGRWLPMALSR